MHVEGDVGASMDGLYRTLPRAVLMMAIARAQCGRESVLLARAVLGADSAAPSSS